MAHPLRHLIAFTTLAAALCAQTPRSPDQPLRFTVFSSQQIAGLSCLPRGSEPPTKLAFYPTARSPHYEYRGAMPMRIAEGASGAIVAEAVVPPEISDALLLFVAIDATADGAAKPAGALKYRVAVLDDGAARNAAGGLVVINLSGLTLSGSIDGKNVTLKDGLNPAQAVGRSAKIALSTTFKGRTMQSYSGDLRLKKNERALLILFPPYRKGSLEVQSRMLVDEPPAAPTPRTH